MIQVYPLATQSVGFQVILGDEFLGWLKLLFLIQLVKGRGGPNLPSPKKATQRLPLAPFPFDVSTPTTDFTYIPKRASGFLWRTANVRSINIAVIWGTGR